MSREFEAEIYPSCEAPEHEEACNGLGTTRDHFTPKCIGKLYGWKQQQIEAPENIQYLSIPCHIAKDSTTSLRRNVLKQQLAGRLNLSLAEHVEIFNGVTHENEEAA